MELLASVLRRAECYLGGFLKNSEQFLFPRGPRLEPSIAGFPQSLQLGREPEEVDKKSEGFLWGVPKRRRSVEVRMSRKIGAVNWYYKMHLPKTNLRICDVCGHHYEAKHLCRNCYDKVKAETDLIRNQIEARVGDEPEDKGVVVLYEGERAHESFDKSKMLIEVPKTRPKFFSKNLLQKTTVGIDSESTTVTQTPEKPQISSS